MARTSTSGSIRNGSFRKTHRLILAVLPFAPDTTTFEYKACDVSMLATESKLTEHLIGIGEEIAVSGLFVSRTGNKRNIPIVRFGNLAAMPVEKLPDKKGLDYHAYLIEVRSIGGLSGSPVFAFLGPSRVHEGKINLLQTVLLLLGVVRGHWRQPRTNRRVSALADDAANLNLGIAVVTSATELEAIINGDHLAQGRAAKDEKLISESAAAIREDSTI